MNRLVIMLLVLTLTGSSPAPQEKHNQPRAGAGSSSTPGPAGGVPSSGAGGTSNNFRRNKGYRDWRGSRGDPALINTLWKSKTPLGNAEPYIVLALLIGFVTVVIGCWLSDNCWSPEPEQLVTIA